MGLIELSYTLSASLEERWDLWAPVWSPMRRVLWFEFDVIWIICFLGNVVCGYGVFCSLLSDAEILFGALCNVFDIKNEIAFSITLSKGLPSVNMKSSSPSFGGILSLSLFYLKDCISISITYKGDSSMKLCEWVITCLQYDSEYAR